jgi:hypothetical protein
LGLLGVLELAAGLDLEVGVRLQVVVQGRSDVASTGHDPDQDADRQRVVEVGEEEAGAYQIAADQRVGFEDPADPDPRGPGLGERDRDDRADRVRPRSSPISTTCSPKAGLRDRAQAVNYAYRTGIATPPH